MMYAGEIAGNLVSVAKRRKRTRAYRIKLCLAVVNSIAYADHSVRKGPIIPTKNHSDLPRRKRRNAPSEGNPLEGRRRNRNARPSGRKSSATADRVFNIFTYVVRRRLVAFQSSFIGILSIVTGWGPIFLMYICPISYGPCFGCI